LLEGETTSICIELTISIKPTTAGGAKAGNVPGSGYAQAPIDMRQTVRQGRSRRQRTADCGMREARYR